MLFGRFYLGKLMFATDRCTGCGLCALQCPVDAIRMWGQRKPRPYWTFSCESCMRCLAYCPEQAIEASHSLAVVFYLLISGMTTAWLTARLAAAWPWFDPGTTSGGILWWLMYYVYFVVALFVVYFVFWLLLKLRPFNLLFTYTTLTHWYRRYREPDTKVATLKRSVTLPPVGNPPAMGENEKHD